MKIEIISLKSKFYLKAKMKIQIFSTTKNLKLPGRSVLNLHFAIQTFQILFYKLINSIITQQKCP